MLTLLVLAGMAAMPAAAQENPPDTASFVMFDFEYGQQTTPFWGYHAKWTDDKEKSFDDSTLFGDSKLTSVDTLTGDYFRDSLGMPDERVFPKGHDSLSMNCLKFGFALGDRLLAACEGTCSYPPHVGLGWGFITKDPRYLDLTGAPSISFWAKADTAPLVINVSIGTQDTTAGASDYSQLFTLTGEWKQYSVLLTPSLTFKQPAWSPFKPFDIKKVTGMSIDISKGDNADHPLNALFIDDITVQNWHYVEPPIDTTPIDGIRKTQLVGARGLRLLRDGNVLRIRLPQIYRGHSGVVEALDLRGRVADHAAFGPNQDEVTLGRMRNVPAKGMALRVILAQPKR